MGFDPFDVLIERGEKSKKRKALKCVQPNVDEKDIPMVIPYTIFAELAGDAGYTYINNDAWVFFDKVMKMKIKEFLIKSVVNSDYVGDDGILTDKDALDVIHQTCYLNIKKKEKEKEKDLKIKK